MPSTAARLALASLLLAAVPASAKDPEFTLTVKPEKDTVALGETIRMQVTLKSDSAKAWAPNPLRLAGNGVVFQVAYGGKTFQLARLFGKYTGSAFRPDPVAKTDPLQAKKSISAPVELIALRPGKIRFTAVFAGLPPEACPDPVEAKPVEVTVTPGKKGETRIGARITTDKGVMNAELYPDLAYNTVHNFLMLANQHFYKDLVFHRVYKGFMVQTGCPKGNGTGGPDWSIPLEANALKHDRGVLSMAREKHPNTAGSQFFVVHGPASSLDGQYAGFGKLLDGLEVLDAIAAVPCRAKPGVDPVPTDPIQKPVLKSVEMILIP